MIDERISLKDCLVAYLGPETNTPPLLTEYLYSNKKYLLLFGFDEWGFLNHYYFAYIVCRYSPEKNCYNLAPTFTELKQRIWVYNLLDIKHCITMIFNGNKIDPEYKKGEVVLFDKPCLIRGQDIRDRSYSGYGYTTKFIIIGIMIEKICR